MKRGILTWSIIILALIITSMAGIGLWRQLTTPQPVIYNPIVLGGLEVPQSENITIDEAIEIITEARFSHVIFKASLEAGMSQPTEWTGTITDQDKIIARYDKILALLERLKQPIIEIRKIYCCERT